MNYKLSFTKFELNNKKCAIWYKNFSYLFVSIFYW